MFSEYAQCSLEEIAEQYIELNEIYSILLCMGNVENQ